MEGGGVVWKWWRPRELRLQTRAGGGGRPSRRPCVFARRGPAVAAAATVAPLPSFALARPRSHLPAPVLPLSFARTRSPTLIRVRASSLIHVRASSFMCICPVAFASSRLRTLVHVCGCSCCPFARPPSFVFMRPCLCAFARSHLPHLRALVCVCGCSCHPLSCGRSCHRVLLALVFTCACYLHHIHN